MNKFIFSFLLVAFAASLSAQNDTVYLSFVPTDIKCGEKKGITLRVKNFTNMVSMNFSTRYEKNLIQFKDFNGTNATTISIANDVTLSDYANGQTFAWSKATPVTVADGDFFNLNFSPAAESGGLRGLIEMTNTPVAFKFESLVAGVKKTLPYKITNGQFQIIDNIAPTITCPASQFVTIPSADNSLIANGIGAVFQDVDCGKATISYELKGATTASGNNQDANGKTFNIGTTNVLYTAKDNSENKVSCPFQVIVSKSADVAFYTTAPIVNCSDTTFSIETRVANFRTITATDFSFLFDKNVLQLKSVSNQNAAILAGDPMFVSTIDANKGKVRVSFTNVVGMTLPDNSLLYTLTFRKISGAAAAVFNFSNVEVTTVMSGSTPVSTQAIPTNVLFLDTEHPTIICPKDTMLYTTLSLQNNAQLFGVQAIATDNCQVQPITYTFKGATNIPSTPSIAGKFFNIGTTIVNADVKDFASNTKTCEFKVIVRQPSFLVLSDTLDCRADSIVVDLSVKDFNKMKKFDAAIEWNKDSLQFKRITYVTPWTATNTTATLSGALNTLNVAFNSVGVAGTSVPDNQIVAKVTYKILATKINDKYKVITSVSLAKLANDSVVIAKGNNAYLSILDTEGPKIIGCPNDTIIKTKQCYFDYKWGIPSVADFCTKVKDTLTNAPANGMARINAGLKPIIYFYTYRDQYLNESTCKFSVTVLDTIKPKFSNCIANDTLNLAITGALGNCNAVFNDDFSVKPTVVEDCISRTTATYKVGDIVPEGLQKHIITVRDTSGNSATCTRYIKVTDKTSPIFESGYFDSPTKILYAPQDKCGANFTFVQPKAANLCGRPVTVTSDSTSGAFFKVGSSKIVFTATDDRGRKTTSSLFIVVLDTVAAKILNCPKQAIELFANTDCEALYKAPILQYTDNCITTPQNTTLNDAPANNLYPVGKKIITYLAPGSNCQVTVNVKDTLKPLIDCPFSFSKNTTAGNCKVLINALPAPVNLKDNCGVPTYSVSPTIFQYPVGKTTLTYTAKDAFDNIKSCTFDVIILDKTAPVIDCNQSDISVFADTDKTTTTATWTAPTATDNCGNAKVTLTSSHISGAIFSIGKTVVTYTAKDSSGNTATCSFNILVQDNQKPKILNCPTSTVTQGTGVNCEYNFSLLKSFTASDNHKITFRDSTGTRPMGKYAIGSYPMTYTVKDSSGNASATCAFTLQVIDKAAPRKVLCPVDADNTFVAKTGDCDVTLTGFAQLKFPTFKDDCDATLKYDTLRLVNNVWTNGLPPNLLFKAGTTRLAMIAKDAAMNSDTCFFNVVVTGNVKPSIAATDCGVGNIIYKATSCTTTLATPYIAPAVVFSPCSAKDTAGYNFSPNKAFAIGQHTIVYTARDKNGNTATCSFTVTIEDKDAPTIVFKKDTILVLSQSCSAKATWDEPTVKDFPCDTAKVIIAPSPVWQSGGTFPIGFTTVTYKATDQSGNSSTKNIYIQIVDNEAPSFVKCPKNVEVSIDGEVLADPDNVLDNTLTATNGKCDSINLAYKATAFQATDNCDASVTNFIFPIQYLPVKANIYSLGENKISVIAQDKSKNKGICEFKIIVKPFGSKPKATVSDTMPCVGDAITLKVDSIAGGKVNWTSVNGFISSKFINTIKNVTSLQSGIYKVFYQKGNCKSAVDSVRFEVLSAPATKADTLKLLSGTSKSGNIITNDILTKGAKYKVNWQPVVSSLGTFTGKDNGEFSFEAKKGAEGVLVPAVTYDICYDDCPGACAKNQTLVIIVTKDVPTDCQISNLLTPNGDGFNDKLEIDCLSNTIGATITIYSQWGEVVYSSDDYKGDWDGTWRGKALPDATYFYVFQKSLNDAAKKGYITIFR